MAANLSADGVTLFAYGIDKLYHLFCGCRVSTTDNVLLALVYKLLRTFYFNIRCINFANAAYVGNNINTLCF